MQVCLYWLDVLRGGDGEYRRRGLDCVTAGHMYDSRFIYRLLEILRGASAVVTNDLGTHIVYAGVLGKPVWVLPQQVEVAHAENAPPQARQPVRRAQASGATLPGELQSMFAEPRAEPTAAQRRFVEELGGARHVRSPEEIDALLEQAEAASRGIPATRRAAYRARVGARLLRNSLRETRRRARRR